ncbi:lytic murein transglycosylase, partial [Achromobacter sp. AGC39]
MRLRSSRPRIDSPGLSRLVLAAAIIAAVGTAHAQSPASATGSRAQSAPAPAQPQPTLTPKRSFDDVVAEQEAAKAGTATPAPAAA